MESNRIERATKTSFKINKVPHTISDEEYKEIMVKIAENCKIGPFKATSGIILPYYLNATTNMMDKYLAPKICKLCHDYLEASLEELIPNDNKENVLLCGMEVAGGMMVSQLCSVGSKLNEQLDYVYIRKEKKTSGTCQQLEGPKFITSRHPESPKVYGIWIDDALSTGSSMTEGIKLLKADYNVEIVAALYLVDRSRDRKTLPKERQHLADPIYDSIKIYALYDLEDIDQFVKVKN